jgi:hypothetical protein
MFAKELIDLYGVIRDAPMGRHSVHRRIINYRDGMGTDSSRRLVDVEAG